MPSNHHVMVFYRTSSRKTQGVVHRSTQTIWSDKKPTCGRWKELVVRKKLSTRSEFTVALSISILLESHTLLQYIVAWYLRMSARYGTKYSSSSNLQRIRVHVLGMRLSIRYLLAIILIRQATNRIQYAISFYIWTINPNKHDTTVQHSIVSPTYSSYAHNRVMFHHVHHSNNYLLVATRVVHPQSTQNTSYLHYRVIYIQRALQR